MWGHQVLPAALPVPFSTTLSLAPLVYLCANVGQQGLLVVRLPALFVPHSTSLGPPQPCESSPPRCPSPPLLRVWMNVYFLFPWCRTSLSFNFLTVLVVRGGAVCLPTPPSWFSKVVVFNRCHGLRKTGTEFKLYPFLALLWPWTYAKESHFFCLATMEQLIALLFISVLFLSLSLYPSLSLSHPTC